MHRVERLILARDSSVGKTSGRREIATMKSQAYRPDRRNSGKRLAEGNMLHQTPVKVSRRSQCRRDHIAKSTCDTENTIESGRDGQVGQTSQRSHSVLPKDISFMQCCQDDSKLTPTKTTLCSIGETEGHSSRPLAEDPSSYRRDIYTPLKSLCPITSFTDEITYQMYVVVAHNHRWEVM